LVLLGLVELRKLLVLHVLELLSDVLVLLQQLLHLQPFELLLLLNAQLDLLSQCLEFSLLLLPQLVQEILYLLVAVAGIFGELLLLELVDAVLYLVRLQVVLLLRECLLNVTKVDKFGAFLGTGWNRLADFPFVAGLP